jgi:hypothetical protein
MLATLILAAACGTAPALTDPDTAGLTAPLISIVSLALSFILVLTLSLLGVPPSHPRGETQTDTQTEEV